MHNRLLDIPIMIALEHMHGLHCGPILIYSASFSLIHNSSFGSSESFNDCTPVVLKWQQSNPDYKVDPLNSTACCTIPGATCITNANIILKV